MKQSRRRGQPGRAIAATNITTQLRQKVMPLETLPTAPQCLKPDEREYQVYGSQVLPSRHYRVTIAPMRLLPAHACNPKAQANPGAASLPLGYLQHLAYHLIPARPSPPSLSVVSVLLSPRPLPSHAGTRGMACMSSPRSPGLSVMCCRASDTAPGGSRRNHEVGKGPGGRHRPHEHGSIWVEGCTSRALPCGSERQRRRTEQTPMHERARRAPAAHSPVSPPSTPPMSSARRNLCRGGHTPARRWRCANAR